jgi:hypothetical protein
MDQALTAFREAADRENLHRRERRRYSSTLRQQAIEYWQQRRRHEGARAIAAAPGVSLTTLQRWTRGIAAWPRFRRVEVRTAATPAGGPGPVVISLVTFYSHELRCLPRVEVVRWSSTRTRGVNERRPAASLRGAPARFSTPGR